MTYFVLPNVNELAIYISGLALSLSIQRSTLETRKWLLSLAQMYLDALGVIIEVDAYGEFT